jgi:hypothetical protein
MNAMSHGAGARVLVTAAAQPVSRATSETIRFDGGVMRTGIVVREQRLTRGEAGGSEARIDRHRHARVKFLGRSRGGGVTVVRVLFSVTTNGTSWPIVPANGCTPHEETDAPAQARFVASPATVPAAARTNLRRLRMPDARCLGMRLLSFAVCGWVFGGT